MLSSILSDADTIIVEEPFSGLDRNSQLLMADILKMLKDEGKTILFSTKLIYFGFHVADELFLLKKGKVKHIRNDFQRENDYEHEIIRLLTE